MKYRAAQNLYHKDLLQGSSFSLRGGGGGGGGGALGLVSLRTWLGGGLWYQSRSFVSTVCF